MPRKKGLKTPCCGPFAQKRKKLDELDATVRRLLKNIEERPKAQAAVDKAMAERRLLAGWLAAHSFVPPMARGGRATRIFASGKGERGPQNSGG